MAETLGLVASGVAVAQLASAIITSGIKLKQLFDEVKDVPETITSFLDHIDMLTSTLWAVEDEQSRLPLPNIVSSSDALVQKSLQNCQKALDHLTGLLEDLEVRINSSQGLKRRIGKVKVILKKDVLAKYERRLDMSLRLLSLSQQLYMIGLQRVQPDIVLSRLLTLLGSGMATPAFGRNNVNNRLDAVKESSANQKLLTIANSTTQCLDIDSSDKITVPIEKSLADTKFVPYHSSTSLSTYWPYESIKPTSRLGLASITGLVEVAIIQDTNLADVLGETRDEDSQTMKSSVSCETTPRFHARLHLPRWLSYKVWECATQKSLWGWSYHFRTYNAIDFDGEVFRMMRRVGTTYQQKLEILQKAFKERRASIYDQLPNGWTLLHYYAIFEPMLCLFLLDQGADGDVVSSRGLKPVAYLNMLKLTSITPGSQIRIFQRLLPPSELDEKNKITALSCLASRESWCYIQKQTWPEYYHPSNSACRLEVAENMAGMGSPHGCQPEIINLALFGEDTPAGDFQFLKSPDDTRALSNIISYVAKKFGGLKARSRKLRSNNFKTLETLQNLLRGIIVSYGFYHSSTTWEPAEPQFLAVAKGYYSSLGTSSIKVFQSTLWDDAMVPWLECLRHCGIGLVEYGQYQKMELKSVWGLFFTYDSGPDMVHLINFKYGPNILDWQFWWSEPTDHFAGEFWHYIESAFSAESEPCMPGAWVE